jgi:CHAT domain-containing protein
MLKPIRKIIGLIAAALLTTTSLTAQSPADLLAQADDLAVHGKSSKAQSLYLQAETEFRNAGDSRNEMYAKFGILKYNVQLGSYTASREELEQILATPLVEGDPHLKIRGLEILGTIDMNENTPAAFNDWTNLLTTAKAIGDAKWENRANGYLGIVAGINGDVGSAGKALFQAVSKAEELGDVAGELTFGIWLANGMSTNGLGDGAIRIINRVEALAKKNGYTDMPLQFSIAKVRALSASSSNHGRADAKALLQAALADARREGILGAQTDLLSQAGQMAMDENDYVGAEKSFAEQVEVAKQASLPSMRADGLLHLSQIYRIQRQGDKAELAIDQGTAALRDMQESYDLPRFFAEKAEVQLLLGHTKAADALYEQATNLIEGLLVNAPSSRVKSSMIGSMSEIYLGHFRLAWNHLHDGPKAFRIIESARGRALVDSLGSPEKFGTQVQKSPAEEEISRLQRTLLHARLNANNTRRVLAQLDAAYDKAFPAEYEGNRKEVGQLKRQSVSLDALRRQLRPGEMFVEYVLDAKTSYAMEVTRSGLTIHSLPGRSEIDRLTKKFLFAINGKTDVNASAKALYVSIMSPMAREQPTSLIVVPDGPLNSIPFGALVDQKGAYLSQTLTVSDAPSAAVYLALRTGARFETATKPFLGIAYSPPESKGTLVATSNTRGVFDLRGPHLSPLPFAREEIVTAGDTLGAGAVVLNGDDASESKLKALPLQDFKVIHLAAHAVGNQVEPDRAGLVLAPGNGTEDGLWQAREIRRTRMNADVIVLSACETGVGHLQGEEGVMNLARAFFTAGAKSVVASLWSVEDRSTATLMDSFYQHLAAGATVSDALRQAQLDFIRDFGERAQPYLWAGFQVIGDGTRTINVATNKTIIRSAR